MCGRESEVKVKVAQLCLTLCDPMDSSPWNSPGQNTGVGSLSLLQGIFSTQGLNPGIQPRSPLYQLSHEGSSRILEWVAYPFSSRSSYSGIEPGSPALQGDSLPTQLSGREWSLKYSVLSVFPLLLKVEY